METEFVEKEKVRSNFAGSFATLMKRHHGDRLPLDVALEDFDFSSIKAHLDSEREKRNARSAEEKKRETEENQSRANYYNYCLFDDGVEKTANNLVEPPGIFRGRGEHPSAGLLKNRIVPE